VAIKVPTFFGSGTRSLAERSKRIVIVSACPNTMQRLNDAFELNNVAQSETFQFDVQSCKSADEALLMYHRWHPDLMLVHSSIGMQAANVMVRDIRKNESERHTGIIFVSEGAIDRREAVEILENGADEFFSAEANPREVRARVNAVLRLKELSDRLRSANHRLEMLSHTDELTGLANMRLFYQKYAAAMLDCRDGKLPVGIIMFDLDRFKCVNDSTNHLIGSYVIGEVGKIVRLGGVLHSADTAARYGGDEYIILTHDLDIAMTVRKAEALRALIESALFMREGITVQLTASLGVAWAAPGFTGAADDLMKAADLMCYRSKKKGRNCVSAIRVDEKLNLDELSDENSRRMTVRFERKNSHG
jgi:diguanylate cyclase (GGDEF)-like protein